MTQENMTAAVGGLKKKEMDRVQNLPSHVTDISGG